MQARENVRYRLDLPRSGVFLVEAERLLRCLAENGDFGQVRYLAEQQNLLGKASRETIKAVLKAFRRIFLNAPPELPSAVVVGKALRAPIPQVAKRQILFPYHLLGDLLVLDAYRALVLPAAGNGSLTPSEVLAYLDAQTGDHPELAGWSAYSKLRWARGFLALLRAFELLERAPGTKLLPLDLRLEAFALFWLHLREKGLSFHQATEANLWPLLGLGKAKLDSLLAAGEARAWWQYRRAGAMVEFFTPFSSTEEWLEVGISGAQT